MLTVTNRTHNTVTVQFTGADLKKWYAAHGQNMVYICHVLEKVIADENVFSQKFITPFSHELIQQLRDAVPKRFRMQKSDSSVITLHLLRKYHSRSERMVNPAITRMNLLKCIPDDHVFTLRFH